MSGRKQLVKTVHMFCVGPDAALRVSDALEGRSTW